MIMNVVILGCGRVGAVLANRLVREGHQVAVIDRDPEAFKRLPKDTSAKLVLGTGIDEDVLRRAALDQADAFVAATNSDNTNIMAVQVAKEIFHVPKVIARIYDPLNEEVFRSLGLETISPTMLGVERIQAVLIGKGKG